MQTEIAIAADAARSAPAQSGEAIKTPDRWRAADPTKILGWLAPPGEYPWMVYLSFPSLHEHGRYDQCGGVLLAPEWVITAAHCVVGADNETPRPARDFFGVSARRSADLNDLYGSPGEEFRVRAVFAHPDYVGANPGPDRFKYDNDIALLKIDRRLQAPTLPLLRLAEYETLDGLPAWIAGWGATGGGSPYSEELREARVSIMSPEKCREKEDFREHISPNMICAKPEKEKQFVGICRGDSGGPLLAELVSAEGRIERLAGVASWAFVDTDGCPKHGSYSVFARIDSAVSWIEQTIKDN